MTRAATIPSDSPPPAAEPVVSVRDQIIDAADEYFSRFGYSKTTVADLARAIGFSKAYIYKFFDSKQSIGEAICARCLAGQLVVVMAAVESAKGPHERIRAFFKAISEESRAQFFNDRQLYDIVAHSCAERWASSESYVAKLLEILTGLLREGRDTGAFERKTPLDEVCRGIWISLSPFTDPVMLQHNLDAVESGLPDVLSVVLRSLAP